MSELYGDYLQLARLALSGRKDDVLALLRRAASRGNNELRPEFRAQLRELLKENEGMGLSLRRASQSGGGGSSSSHLIEGFSDLALDPVWAPQISEFLNGIVEERKKLDLLERAGLNPTRSILFVGPPGVGKTLAANWLAKIVGRRLVYLDLASLMSSHLGRTGANLSASLKNAASGSAVLLLDEFDSIGKRRDDQGDVGELKRLVNVLLQALDQWPSDGLLIAATNHPELLDRAVWRRFDRVIEFPMPSIKELEEFAVRKLKMVGAPEPQNLAGLLAIALQGESFAGMELWINRHIRSAIVNGHEIESYILMEVQNLLVDQPKELRSKAAKALIASGVSQRSTASLLGMSRDTIRKSLNREA